LVPEIQQKILSSRALAQTKEMTMKTKILAAVSALALTAALVSPASATCRNCGPQKDKASISIGSQGGAGNVGGGNVKGNGPKGVVTDSLTTKAFDANSSIKYDNGKTSIKGSTSGHVATTGFAAAGASGTKHAEASTYEEGGAAVSSEVEVQN
jgi:uncharacterized membrane protein